MDIPRKNEECVIAIEDLGRDGEGIGRYEGYTLFVKDAIPGDTVRCVVTKAGKTYGYAHLLQVITPSKDRRKMPCPVGKTCGGCSLLAMDYGAQLIFKQRMVEETLRRVGGYEGEVLPVLGAPEEFRYRNKAAYPVAEKDGRLVAGFYAQHSHRIIEHTDCLLGPEEFPAILRAVLKLCAKAGITLRHVLLRKGFATGEIHVCLIGSGKMPAKTLAERLCKAFPAIVGVSWNENTTEGNVILGKKTTVLTGRAYLLETIGNRTYAISPESFFQVHPAQTKRLYDKVREFAGLTGNEDVYDLYCGTGTIGLYLADRARSVTGIEIVPRAVEDAKANAVRNGIKNAAFYAGKAEELFPELVAGKGGTEGAADTAASAMPAGPASADTVVIVDPPRKGCDRALLDTILRVRPSRCVYVSCDPATLARDLKILSDGGYLISMIQPLDLFPQSCHCESVVLLTRAGL